MDEKAYINKHDSVVFLGDDDERLPSFLAAGYRELEITDRVVMQAVEHTVSNQTEVDRDGVAPVTFGDLADALDRGESLDLPPAHSDHVDYIQKVRALRARNDKERKKDQAPAKILRKGKK